MKRFFSALSALFFIGGCNMSQETGVNAVPTENSEVNNLSNYNILEETDSFKNECLIDFGDTITISGQGAWIDGNCVKISGGGVYTVTGTIDDGMIYVDGDETVKLVLNNASITNKSGCAVFSSGKKLIIESAEGTENFLTDSESYSYSEDFESKEDKEPDSAVYSKNTVILTGKGVLNVKGNFKNGITGNDELIIKEANINVEAENNGIKGKDSLTAENSDIKVISRGDSIKTDNAEAGTISVKDCSLTLETEGDGIQADSSLSITGGVVSITTKGDVASDEELSSKGIKGGDITVENCSLTVNATDHAVKATASLTLTGGSLEISSETGKGLASEGVLTVNNSDINILKSEEGIESKSNLNINGGNINITASDDGINTGGDDLTAEHTINISGGNIVVNAGGDGFDSNGSINVTGGVVVVFGPEKSGNAPLDCGEFGGKINISGGMVLAMGVADMMSFPEGSYLFSSAFNGKSGDRITVADSDNNIIISAVTPKNAKSVIFCNGGDVTAYKLISGGNTDISNDIIISEGTVTGGIQLTSEEGTSFGGFGKGGRGGKNDRFNGEVPEGMPEGMNPGFHGGERPEGMPEPPENGMIPEMPSV